MLGRFARLHAPLALAVLAACGDPSGVTTPNPVPASDTSAPALQREMRGLWIATVANIDFPSRSTLTAAQQRAELVDLLTRAAATGINTIIFHVRPAGDAVYQSALEPWGAMLTGTQGSDPGYDPLAFVITEAHARGLEVHAWINPFRAGNASDTTKLAASHLFRTRRDLIRVYGTQIWMDPGEPEVHDHTLRVVADIVRRYDIDGVHADDYFYPYVQTNGSGQAIAFPDDATYALYGAALPRADWRRANVDRFVERMYREVHAIKPTIKVGISPFGIWRPGFPPSVQGLDAYASIYADSRRWLQEGWVDYLAPQLYWAISAPQQSFPALLDWWLEQNARGRHVWPGLAAYRVANGTSSAFSMQEIPSQIGLTRTRPAGTGHLLYNATWTLKQSSGALASALASTVYKGPALPPASPWLDATPPGAPIVAVSSGMLQMTPSPGDPVRWWAIRRCVAGVWSTRIQFGSETTLALDAATERILVQAVDQAGQVSASAEWRRP